MKIVRLYELGERWLESVEMPRNAKILSVITRDDIPHIWVLVDTESDADTKVYQFRLTTSRELFTDSDFTYVGTFQQHNGRHIGHVFEVQS